MKSLGGTNSIGSSQCVDHVPMAAPDVTTTFGFFTAQCGVLRHTSILDRQSEIRAQVILSLHPAVRALRESEDKIPNWTTAGG